MKIHGGRSDRQLPKSRRDRRRAFLICCNIFAALAWAIVITYWSRSLLIKQTPPPPSSPTVQISPDVRSVDLWPDDYQHPAFTETLKSCDPNSNTTKCMTFVPQGVNEDRIGVLRSPGRLGLLFEKFVAEVVQLHSPENSTTGTKVVLIPTSHVPPYGYGKTHGLTKIIRFAALPLRLAAADLVMERINQQELTTENVQYADIQQATRQIVRWHCRLSHVAAHTSLATITLEQIMNDPWGIEYEIIQFLNLKPVTFSMEEHLMGDYHVDEDGLEDSIDQILMPSAALLLRIDQKQQLTTTIEDLLDQVVDEELDLTNNLKDWPCLSFWNAGDKSTPTIMNTIAKHTAQDLSPKCNAEYTSCFVARDKCEANGDALCPEAKK